MTTFTRGHTPRTPLCMHSCLSTALADRVPRPANRACPSLEMVSRVGLSRGSRGPHWLFAVTASVRSLETRVSPPTRSQRPAEVEASTSLVKPGCMPCLSGQRCGARALAPASSRGDKFFPLLPAFPILGPPRVGRETKRPSTALARLNEAAARSVCMSTSRQREAARGCHELSHQMPL